MCLCAEAFCSVPRCSSLKRDCDAASGSFFQQSSFATHAICTTNNLIRVPKDLPLEQLAPLGCGVQTGAGAVINSFQARVSYRHCVCL